MKARIPSGGGVEYTDKSISVPLCEPPDEDTAITNSESSVLAPGEGDDYTAQSVPPVLESPGAQPISKFDCDVNVVTGIMSSKPLSLSLCLSLSLSLCLFHKSDDKTK